MQACDGFQAHVSHLNGSVVVALAGEIDMATAPRFRAVLEAAVAASNHVILDCQRLTFIDSCGLREVVLAVQRLGRARFGDTVQRDRCADDRDHGVGAGRLSPH